MRQCDAIAAPPPPSTCPIIPPSPPSACHSHRSTCWSLGVPDLDCPNAAPCCFDGCGSTCLPPPPLIPPPLHHGPIHHHPLPVPDSPIHPSHMYMFHPADLHHHQPLLPLHHQLVKSGPLDHTLHQALPLPPHPAPHHHHSPPVRIEHHGTPRPHRQTGSRTPRPQGRGHLEQPQDHAGRSLHSPHHTHLSPITQSGEEERPAGVTRVDPASSLIASFAQPHLPPPGHVSLLPEPLVNPPQTKSILGDIKPFVSFGGSHVPYSL